MVDRTLGKDVGIPAVRPADGLDAATLALDPATGTYGPGNTFIVKPSLLIPTRVPSKAFIFLKTKCPGRAA